MFFDSSYYPPGRNFSNENNPRVFLDISVDGEPAERVIIELFANVVPITAENFRALCTGEKGISKTSGAPLHYKGTVFRHIYSGLLAEGGDLSETQDGKNEDSIYGGQFKDENFKLYHSEPGMLSMRNRGGNANGSMFYITFARLYHLDRLNVVFGKVIKGLPALCHINEFGTPSGKPSGVVKIVESGQIPEDKENPRVFLDISVDGEPAERVIFELFANVAPITVENFRALCTGETGNSKTTGRPLHYKGTVFHQILKGFFAEGGDLSEEQDGKGEDSIYGGYFKDEDHKLYHREPGMLSMGNRGKGETNGSLFLITFKQLGYLDGLHVVFGKVIKGMPTLCHINEYGTSNGTPSGVVKIVECGQIPEDEGENKKSLKRASSSNERVKDYNDEREKQRKHSSSEGPLQISERGEISEDKKNNVMESDQDRGRPFLFPRERPRQQVGNDSIVAMLAELRQQSDWMMASIREIARAGAVNLPDYPLPRPQQGDRRYD